MIIGIVIHFYFAKQCSVDTFKMYFIVQIIFYGIYEKLQKQITYDGESLLY